MAGPTAVKIISVQDLRNNSKDIFLPSRLKQVSSTKKGKVVIFVSLVKTGGKDVEGNNTGKIPQVKETVS